jgi:hypothetical protein
MRPRKPRRTVPAEPIALLPKLKWQAEAEAPASTNAAALILYVALAFEAEQPGHEDVRTLGRAWVSYTELETITLNPAVEFAQTGKRPPEQCGLRSCGITRRVKPSRCHGRAATRPSSSKKLLGTVHFWMAGSSPAMTIAGVVPLQLPDLGSRVCPDRSFRPGRSDWLGSRQR